MGSSRRVCESQTLYDGTLERGLLALCHAYGADIHRVIGPSPTLAGGADSAVDAAAKAASKFAETAAETTKVGA